MRLFEPSCRLFSSLDGTIEQFAERSRTSTLGTFFAMASAMGTNSPTLMR